MKAPVVCPLTEYGCCHTIVRYDFGNHLITVQHQQSLLTFLEKLQESLKGINPNTKSLTTTSTAVEQENIDHSSLMEIEHANTSYSSTHINDLFVELRKCYELLTILTQGAQTSLNDTNRLNTELLHLNNPMTGIHKQLNEPKKNITEIDNYIATIGANQERLQQDLSYARQKIEEIQNVSYDGNLIWRVTSVSDKTPNAK
ncbi:unnamed protein product, partial [Didymodactylos carnosus]